MVNKMRCSSSRVKDSLPENFSRNKIKVLVYYLTVGDKVISRRITGAERDIHQVDFEEEI